MSRITRWIVADAGLTDAGSLRYVLGKSEQATGRRLLRHILLAIVYISVLIFGAVTINPSQDGASADVYDALYASTVITQFLVSAVAFGLTVHTVHTLRRKQTWDSLRATAGGSAAAIRAAWAATVYYRLSGLLGVLVYAPRIVLLGFLLWDLTAFNGDYLTLIAGGHQPSIAPPFEILLLGAYIAAAFLLPLSAVGLEAAVGLLFSTFARSRQTATLIQIVLTAGRFLWSVIPAAYLSEHLSQALGLVDPGALRTSFLASSIAGDWGMSSMNISNIDTIWSNVGSSAFFGAVFLGVVLLQSGLTVLILRWAARRAQTID